MTERYNQSK